MYTVYTSFIAEITILELELVFINLTFNKTRQHTLVTL